MLTKTRTLNKTIRYGLLAMGLVITGLLFRPVGHLWRATNRNQPPIAALAKGYADDVSWLNKTRIDSLVEVSADSATTLWQLTGLLTYAQKQRLPVSIAGAKHSMGGHTIAPDGIRIDILPFKKLVLDTTS